jgi:hypothetical protein
MGLFGIPGPWTVLDLVWNFIWECIRKVWIGCMVLLCTVFMFFILGLFLSNFEKTLTLISPKNYDAICDWVSGTRYLLGSIDSLGERCILWWRSTPAI